MDPMLGNSGPPSSGGAIASESKSTGAGMGGGGTGGIAACAATVSSGSDCTIGNGDVDCMLATSVDWHWIESGICICM